MTEPPAITSTFRVGRHRVTLTLPVIPHGSVGEATAEWEPPPERLSADEWAAFALACDRAVAAYEAYTRGRVIPLAKDNGLVSG